MTTQQAGATKARPLDVLGIGEQEEQAYRWLLDHPGASVAEVARVLSLSPNKTQRLLDSIEAKGLASHSLQRPRRYIPASPDIALKALSVQRQEELQRADGVIQELHKQVISRHNSDEQQQMAELIMGRERILQAFKQIQLGAQQKVISLVRPPFLVSRLDIPYEEDHHEQTIAQARGVSYRSVVDTEFLDLPLAVRRVREEKERGEDIRVVPKLPFKMILADRLLAIIPLNFQQPEGPALLVRSSVLLDALYLLFEFIWERAAPISFARAGGLDISGYQDKVKISKDNGNLLSLLATGMNDKRIMAELGISRSTYSRRIAELMKALNAGSRFQLGWLAKEYMSTKPRVGNRYPVG